MKKIGKMIAILCLLSMGMVLCLSVSAYQNTQTTETVDSPNEINDGEIPDAVENFIGTNVMNATEYQAQDDGSGQEKPGEELQD